MGSLFRLTYDIDLLNTDNAQAIEHSPIRLFFDRIVLASLERSIRHRLGMEVG